jgi:uncharacterized protein (DUF2147 family)
MFDRRLLLALVAALLGASHAANASGRGDPSGLWLTQAGDAKVEISRCGTAICGKVVWLKAPIDKATGKPQVDDKNPNPALAKRPIVGLSLFASMQPQATGKWSGHIYNADDGKTYTSNVTLLESAKLKIEGCVGIFCGNEVWTKSGR